MSVEWFGAQVRNAAFRALQRVIVQGTENVHTEAVRLILQTTKTGRVYTRRGITHRASAPGQPPASDTGRLVNSGVTSYNLSVPEGVVAFTAEYAPFLEFGTQSIEPRPFLRPAYNNMLPSIRDAAQQALANVYEANVQAQRLRSQTRRPRR